MSVKAMGKVWDTDLPSNKKFVLLAYADHAHHDGTNIYPAIETIAEKTGYHERSVQRITRELEAEGYLVPDGQGPKGTNKWYIPYSDQGDKIAPLTDHTEMGDIPSGDIPSGDKIAPESEQPSINPPTDFGEELKKARELGDQGKEVESWALLLRAMPGAKKQVRLNEIHENLADYFGVKPKWSKVKEFCEYIDLREQNHDEHLGAFVDWLFLKYPDFDLTYWPWSKMQEHWPRAFVENNHSNPVQVDADGFAEVE